MLCLSEDSPSFNVCENNSCEMCVKCLELLYIVLFKLKDKSVFNILISDDRFRSADIHCYLCENDGGFPIRLHPEARDYLYLRIVTLTLGGKNDSGLNI
jgi:hypothetical protein